MSSQSVEERRGVSMNGLFDSPLSTSTLPHMVKKSGVNGNGTDITLQDVVVHVEHMGQRLSSEVKQLSSEMKNMEKRLSSRMDGMEKRLTEHIDALDEDLTATMQDTVRIRAHVGMPVPTE